MLLRIKAQGLQQSPWLAVSDGALGFWKALSKVFPATVHQRCWVHKTANVLNKLPKLIQPKVKQALHEIWMAPTKEDTYKAFGITFSTYSDKYPKAMECLVKDKDEMLAFYDFRNRHHIPYRIAFSNQTLLNSYQVSGIPLTVLINANGMIREHHLGHLSYEQMVKKIHELL